ncbi:MAG: hypothetical protein J5698_05175 [Bacteroidaceae bacterium]|nr:hypothetical protein [Bacteroidaceae bacterium]
MKICPICGKEHSDDDRYCRACGGALIDKEPETPEQAETEEEAAAEEPAEEEKAADTQQGEAAEEKKQAEEKKSRMDDFEAQAREAASQLGEMAAKLGKAAKEGFDAAKSSFSDNKQTADANKETTDGDKEKASAEGKTSAKEQFEKAMDTPDTTGDFDPADIQANRGMAIVAYFGILFLIPLIIAKDSKFARFHTNQGLVLFICWMMCRALTFVPVAGWVFNVVSFLLLVLCILGIINAAQGRAKELPVIGKFRILN